MPTNWWGQAKRCTTKIQPKAVGGSIYQPFSNFDNFRPEVDSEIISGVVIDPTGAKVSVKFGDSRSKRSRDIRLPDFVMNNDHDASLT